MDMQWRPLSAKLLDTPICPSLSMRNTTKLRLCTRANGRIKVFSDIELHRSFLLLFQDLVSVPQVCRLFVFLILLALNWFTLMALDLC